ncbi:hypothetical protein [Streptomyces sp. NPDC001594]
MPEETRRIDLEEWIDDQQVAPALNGGNPIIDVWRAQVEAAGRYAG